MHWGSLKRHLPVDPAGGSGRGTSIDAYYVSKFLDAVAGDLRGRVLVFRDAAVIVDQVDRSAVVDVIDVQPGNAAVTVLADPASPGAIDPASKDCIVLVGCLRWVADLAGTLASAWRGLAPGGVLLVSVPTLAPVTDDDLGPDRWRVTAAGLEEVLMQACPGAESKIMTFGNPVSAVAVMAGLAAEDLSAAELDAHDPRFVVVVAARVQRAGA